MDDNFIPENEQNKNSPGVTSDNQPQVGQQPYGQPDFGQPAQSNAKINGKLFAIISFVLAMVAFLLFSNASSLHTYAELWEDIYSNFDVINALDIEAAYLAIKILAILEIVVSIPSDVLVIFAYIGHSKNVKSGNPVKYVLAFSILATVFANLSIFGSLLYVF